MKIWNRINNSDRKKEKAGKVRFILSSFAREMGLMKTGRLKNYSKKRKYVTVIKL